MKSNNNFQKSSTEQVTPFNIWKPGCYALALAVGFWLLVYSFAPPMFCGTDVFDYKDAGINLATGIGLVTRISPSNPSLELSFYGNYPPLFPVLYGFFVWIFGISPKVNVIFDLMLAAIAGIAFWFAIQPRICYRNQLVPNFLILFLVLLTLPKGPFWADYERPDALGFTLIVVSIGILQHRYTPTRVFLASLIVGINAMISPFCAVLSGFTLAAFYLSNRFSLTKTRKSTSNHDLSPLCLIAIIGVGIPIAIVGILIWIKDPLAIQRFLGHALGKSTGGTSGIGYLLNFNHFTAFSKYNILMHKVKLAFLILVIVLSVGYLVLTNLISRRIKIILSSAIIWVGSIPILLFPYQSNYMSLTATVILVLFARLAIVDPISQNTSVRWVIFASLLFIAIFEVLFIMRDFVIAYDSAPSFQRMQQTLQKLSDSNWPKPLLVATSPSTYFLFKGKGFDVVNIDYLGNPSDLRRIDLFALSFIGTLNPLEPNYPSWWKNVKVEMVYRPVLPQRTRLLGYSLSASSNTWEVELYKRK
jgi:hypothetical protein